MKTTIETIGGKLCTVIRRPFDAEWVREQLAMGIPVIVEHDGWDNFFEKKRVIITSKDNHQSYPMFANNYEHIKSTITILPALPRFPKPEDVKLLYRYASEGLRAHGKYEAHYDNEECSFGANHTIEEGSLIPFIGGTAIREITHAITEDGQRVEIAIEGD